MALPKEHIWMEQPAPREIGAALNHIQDITGPTIIYNLFCGFFLFFVLFITFVSSDGNTPGTLGLGLATFFSAGVVWWLPLHLWYRRATRIHRFARKGRLVESQVLGAKSVLPTKDNKTHTTAQITQLRCLVEDTNGFSYNETILLNQDVTKLMESTETLPMIHDPQTNFALILAPNNTLLLGQRISLKKHDENGI